MGTPLTPSPHTYMISYVGVASCTDEGPGHILRATKGCVVEAALLLLQGNRHQCNVQWGFGIHYSICVSQPQDYYPIKS